MSWMLLKQMKKYTVEFDTSQVKPTLTSAHQFQLI